VNALATIVAANFASRAYAGPADELTFPQTRGATYGEVRKYQALGKFVIAPDASFFLYEWSRPYNWAPLPRSLPPSAQRRPQTLLYLVPIPAVADWSDLDPPTTEVLLPAAPGATYYLGTLSPDAKSVTFYELDRDNNALRAGVVLITKSLPRKITWLSLPPDETRLGEPAIWLSNDQVVYPIEARSARVARASVETGRAEPCRDCDEVAARALVPPIANAPSDAGSDVGAGVIGASSSATPKLPEAARVVAHSVNGELLIQAVDTSETLGLYFTKKGRAVELFSNRRDVSGVADAP
jgi:hypothetical protein